MPPIHTSFVLLVLLALAACQGEREATPPAAPATDAAPSPPVMTREPRREPLVGGPYPALLLSQAQFTERTGPDGKPQPVPGPAKLTILRQTEAGWKPVVIEDPDSNTFHKAMPFDGGILTIGATRAALKTWRFADGAWQQTTHWQPTFGGKFDRLRDIERADVDGDGKADLVIATHDQGVIAVVHPELGWTVEIISQQPDTFVHEIEIGDIDGDDHPDILATPSKPNKLGQEQAGEVRAIRRGKSAWEHATIDAPTDTHAKEILAADTDRDGKTQLFVVWEGAVGKNGEVVRPVTIKEYILVGGKMPAARLVATVPDRQMRSLEAGDVNGDGRTDLVGTSLKAGVWLFEQQGIGWKSTLIDSQSSGFEHPMHLADLDGDGKPEIYVAAEDQHELRRYRWQDGRFEKTVIFALEKGDITWNIGDARL